MVDCKTRTSFSATRALIMLVLLTSAELGQGADYDEHDEEADEDDADVHPFHPGDVNEKKTDEPPGICYTYKPTENKLEPRCCKGWETISTVDAFPTCRPICSPSCVNGTCEPTNICRCLPGYHWPEDISPHICVPECQPPCVNSDCIGPNKCRCRPGFSPSPFSNVCRNASRTHATRPPDPHHIPPSCSPKCVLGRCVAKNNCTCYSGYVPIADRPWECTPHCSSCDGELERCEAPDMCKCVEGYARDEHGKCVPYCQTSCYYGRCVAPNKCECHAGYTYEKNRDMCFPTCTPPCGRHGECISINNCSCDDGFVLGPDGACKGKCTSEKQWDSLSNQCVPLQPPTMKNLPSSPPLECPWPCEHGKCEDEVCKCDRGWGDVDCRRTCKVLPGSNMVDAEDCPALKGCSCPNTTRTAEGNFCEEGLDAECDQETDLSEPGPEVLYIPEWALLVAAVGAGVLMLLLVAIPSAVALHRHHRRLKQQREDDEQTRILQMKGTGRGRMQDVDLDDWRFISP